MQTTRPISASMASRMACKRKQVSTTTRLLVKKRKLPCQHLAGGRRSRSRWHRFPARQKQATARTASATNASTEVELTTLIASLTVAKTGRSRCLLPAFAGETPPTILVPYSMACWLWNVPCAPSISAPGNKRKKKPSLPSYLLARETLADDLCVAANVEVLDRLLVVGGGGKAAN